MRVVVAPATPAGRSALAVVRLSGSGALDIALAVARPLHAAPIQPRIARRVAFCDGSGRFDDGILLFFAGPRSVTGEDVVELTCHGNPVIVQHLVDELLAAGAVMAEAGEFTRRGLLHGKYDLVAAEGVHAAIEASSVAGLRVAQQALDGAHSEAYAELRQALCVVGAELEARLDQPGDALTTEDDDAVSERLEAIAAEAQALARGADRGRRVVDGARVALVGPTNAGKSSLFNALVGRRRALVHHRPGTTRDVLEVRAVLGGAGITLLDTAGERETDDPVEAAGLALGRELTDGADLLVVVLRAREDGPSEEEQHILARTADRRRLLVLNGVDTVPQAPSPPGAVRTSAATGEGVEALSEHIAAAVGGGGIGEGELVIASTRQAERLRAIAAGCAEAVEALPLAGPAVAAELVTECIAAIDELTGASPREGVLDALFQRFCIGK